MPRKISMKIIEREAAELRAAIHKFADAYGRADEALLGSLNPRSQKWQIKVLNRACEILDEQAVIMNAAAQNGNGKGGSHEWWSPIPENIIADSATYRDVTPEMQTRWARERNDEMQRKLDQALEHGKYLGRTELKTALPRWVRYFVRA